MFSPFTAGKAFRVVDSIDVRKTYNLQQSQSNIKNQVQSPALDTNQLQQRLSPVTNQAESSTLINKELQSSSIVTYQAQSPSMTQISQMQQYSSSATNNMQSSSLMDK